MYCQAIQVIFLHFFLYRNVMTMQSYKAGTPKLKSLYKFLLEIMFLSCYDPTYDHQLSGAVSIAFCVVFLQWLKSAVTALSNLKKHNFSCLFFES